ncbi:MAG: radical SAM protein, partial [Nitrospinae bacterium]|nr:radical SAM protein [Nitrospinota bacterium]
MLDKFKKLSNQQSSYKTFLGAGMQLLYGRLAGDVFPWYVNYAITNKCNLRCPYCYIEINDYTKKDPSLDEVKEVLEGLYKLGTRYVCLLGGEPFYRHDLAEIIMFIKKNLKNMIIAISTNGVLIDRNLDVIRMVNKLTVSVEGDKERHDYDRFNEKGEGSYDKIIKNLWLLKENNIKHFSIQTTVSTNTYDAWEHVVHLAKDLECSVLITEVAPHPDDDLHEANLTPEQLQSLWLRIYEMKKQGYPIENSFDSISQTLKFNEYVGPYKIFYDYEEMPGPLKEMAESNKTCSMGKFGLFLDTDGTFYRCATLF